MEYDTIVLGAGAAGLMCAIEAAKRKRKVALIEKAGAIGKKILISGGGRCNFTNIHCTHENYISQNPHFCKSALSRYTPFDFIELVEKYKIAYHEKTLGQQFCDGSSRQIVGLLQRECDQHAVTIMLDATVSEISKDTRFRITIGNRTLSSETLVIACGGLSIPKMGATDFGHRIAKQFGHNLITCRPGLVPLTLPDKQLTSCAELSGTAFPVIASCGEHAFKESFLFTHRGVSGPAILQISSYWQLGGKIELNLLPDKSFTAELLARKNNGEKAELKTILAFHFSKRFAEFMCAQIGSSLPINQYSEKQIERIGATIHHWTIVPNGTEGYAKAEVTVGGVDTNELSSKTMESRKVPGLFFIGEVVDVTGHLGGFNFQWAWASGHAAGGFC